MQHMVRNNISETIFLWITRIGLWLVFAAPLVIAGSLFFPYITGKNFFFRIVVEILFSGWLALIVVAPSYRPKKGLILSAVTAFFGILALATIFGADPYHSFWSNYERMEGFITHIHLFMLFLALASTLRTKFDWSVLFHTSVGVSIIVSVYGFLEHLGKVEVPGSTGERIFSTLGNPIYFAAYLLFHLFILGILFSWTRNMWLRVAYGAIAFFEAYLFLFTETRGALLGLVAGAATVLVLYVLFSHNRRARLAMGGIVLFGILGLGTLFSFRGSEFVLSNSLLTRFTDIRLTSSTAQSRLMIWGIAWEGLKERPILGWGPGNFILPYAKYYNPDLFGNEPWFDRVHNMHLEWLVAGGVLGFLAYIGLIVASAVVVWQLWRRQVFDVHQVAFTGGFFVAYLVQNTFVFDTLVTYIFLITFLAFLYSMRRSIEQSEVQGSGYEPVWGIGALVVGVLVAATIHLAPIRVAGGIIDMLNETARPGVTALKITSLLDELVAENTFGTIEARERYVDIVFQASRTRGISQQDFLMLLDKGVEELRKETEERPHAVRELVTYGKLLQLRSAVTGSERDYNASLSVYEDAWTRAPHYPPIYIGMAETYLTAGDTANAARVMDTVFQEMTRPNQFIYSLLSVYIIANDYETASVRVEEYLERGNTPSYPRDATFEPEKLVTVIQRMQPDDNPASRERLLEAFTRGHAGWRRDKILVGALVQAKIDLHKIEEARELIEQARAEDPLVAESLEEQFFPTN